LKGPAFLYTIHSFAFQKDLLLTLGQVIFTTKKKSFVSREHVVRSSGSNNHFGEAVFFPQIEKRSKLPDHCK
jgi:hypothetical protein